MHYNTDKQDHGLAHSPLKALVMPRPIGWISSLAKDGTANLAPYSFFNLVCDAPPMLMFSSSGEKDSLRNCEATGEFVTNLVSASQFDAMNTSSALVGPEVDEFALAGLEKLPSVSVAPPRVKGSLAHLECRVHDIIDLPSTIPGQRNAMVLGRILEVHIDDRLILEGRIDQAAIKALGRCGYMDYSITDHFFTADRPVA